MLFYTDETTEARSNAGEFFPLPDRAPDLIAAGTLDEAVDALQEALRSWSGDSLRDDAALLAIEILPRPVQTKVGREPPTEPAAQGIAGT